MQKNFITTAKTYNSAYSPVVTHPSTNAPVSCLYMAERTGSLILMILWSYVEEWAGGGEYEVTKPSQQHQTIDQHQAGHHFGRDVHELVPLPVLRAESLLYRFQIPGDCAMDPSTAGNWTRLWNVLVIRTWSLE